MKKDLTSSNSKQRGKLKMPWTDFKALSEREEGKLIEENDVFVVFQKGLILKITEVTFS